MPKAYLWYGKGSGFYFQGQTNRMSTCPPAIWRAGDRMGLSFYTTNLDLLYKNGSKVKLYQGIGKDLTIIRKGIE